MRISNSNNFEKFGDKKQSVETTKKEARALFVQKREQHLTKTCVALSPGFLIYHPLTKKYYFVKI